MPHKVDEEIRIDLKAVVDHFDQEDRAVRDRQIRLWRRLKLYWDGFDNVWWSEVAHDWRIFDNVNTEGEYNNDYYDKPVNVFRAYLESIIAALSIIIPPIKCIPDDAKNPNDLSTAKAGDRIAELVYKHNDVSLLWLHALYVYVTEGLIACYNYTKKDEEFGTYKKHNYEEVDEEHYNCPTCNLELDELFAGINPDEYDPQPLNCPGCENEIDPSLQKTPLTVTRLAGIIDEPKSRQIMEVYGGLYVKVPNYAITQKQCPYLFFSYEEHYSIVMQRFPDLREGWDWQSKTGYDAGGIYDPYERWGRLNPQYQNEYPTEVTTVRCCWLRPASFNVLDEEKADRLKKEFPNGARIILANEEIAEDPVGECLDDHWTLTKNPLSDHLHHDPLGLLLTSIQDITNELVSLVLQTIEHGISQTFADPSVLNFDQYRQTEVSPGSIYPVRPQGGKNVGEAFFETKTATLSREVMPFGREIQNYGQLVSGALPSLFGGSMPGSGETAAQYSMSRAQAQQRLGTTWKMLIIWWKTIFSKVIPAYIKSVEEDEVFVKENSVGNFINVVIRKAELQGKIGRIELEADENLPTTWTQMKDVIMRLMELNNPTILEALTSPENLPFISQAIGLNQFVIPGEADRLKQYEEINLLINSEPLPTEIPDPVTGQAIPIEIPSVEIDPDVDNNAVQAEICRSWLISEEGQLAKQESPLGYKNVLLHMKMHMQIVIQQQMAQLPQPGSEGAPTEETV
jgi:hypothetical protein